MCIEKPLLAATETQEKTASSMSDFAGREF